MISNFIQILTCPEKYKINNIIKKLMLEYKYKDTNTIYIIESYNKESIKITKDLDLINNGRKKLIFEINKIKDKEFGVCESLIKELVVSLIEKNTATNTENNKKKILEIYIEESKKITNNNNLIENYRSILLKNLCK
jgi:hypothetical protein